MASHQRKGRSKASSPARKSAAAQRAQFKLDDTLTFMQILWALDHQLRVTSKRMNTRIGLTGPQRLVVRIIGRFPTISAGGVAAILDIHPSTLTEILQELERRKFVRRVVDPSDSRRSLLELTVHGRRVDRRHAGTVEAAVRDALASLPRRKILVAEEVLRTLTGRLMSK